MRGRITNVLSAVLLGSAIAAAGSRAQGSVAPRSPDALTPQEKEFRESLSPESWARGAEGMTKCTVANPAADFSEQKWKTDSLEGVLVLPRDFHEVPMTAAMDGNRWIGADSSIIEIHGNRALFRGGMGMGGMDIGAPLGVATTCALVIEGRPAPSHTLMLTRPRHGDTLYVDTPNTVIRNGVGLQIIILTHSTSQEAALRAAAQSLKVSPATNQ